MCYGNKQYNHKQTRYQQFKIIMVRKCLFALVTTARTIIKNKCEFPCSVNSPDISLFYSLISFDKKLVHFCSQLLSFSIFHSISSWLEARPCNSKHDQQRELNTRSAAPSSHWYHNHIITIDTSIFMVKQLA